MVKKVHIIANWKMCLLPSASLQLAQDLLDVLLKVNCEAEFTICPDYASLGRVSDWFNNIAIGDQSLVPSGFNIGAQDCAMWDTGSYTGDVSAKSLKDLGCEYVVIGHSERRRYHNEDNKMLSLKIEKAIEAKLRIIFCIGETIDQHERGELESVLDNQLSILKSYQDYQESIEIAYEPVWAIGSGKSATQQDIEKALAIISKILLSMDFVGNKLLYGGSVNELNSRDLLNIDQLSGLLIGSASLKVEKMVKILQNT